MRQHMLTVVIALLAGFFGAFAYGLVDDVLHSPGSDYFSDVSADSPHSDDIGFAVEAGITMGVTPELYGSGAGVSREQMASFQMRDLAAAVALSVELTRVLQMDWGSVAPEMTAQERADMLRWVASLLEYENQARPEAAVGGATVYSHLAERCRSYAIAYDPDGG